MALISDNKHDQRTSGISTQDGDLEISNSSVNSFQTTGDITGKTFLFIRTSEGEATLETSGTVSGSVGSQIFTFGTPLSSPAILASTKSDWNYFGSRVSVTPAEYTIVSSTVTSLVITSHGLTSNDMISLWNVTDGLKEIPAVITDVDTLDITSAGLTVIPTKCFVYDAISLAITLEGTSDRNINLLDNYLDVSTISTPRVLTTPASLVCFNQLNEGERIVVNGESAIGGTVVESEDLTFDPNNYNPTSMTLSNGNLTGFHSNNYDWVALYSQNVLSIGKIYFEIIGSNMVGITLNPTILDDMFTSSGDGYGYYNNGEKFHNWDHVAYGDTFTTTSVVGVGYDYETGELEFFNEGVSQGIAYTLTPQTAVYTALSTNNHNTYTHINFSDTVYLPEGYNRSKTWTQELSNHTDESPIKQAFTKGFEDLQLNGIATTTEFVGVNPKNKLIHTGDSVEFIVNGVKSEVVPSNIVETTYAPSSGDLNNSTTDTVIQMLVNNDIGTNTITSASSVFNTNYLSSNCFSGTSNAWIAQNVTTGWLKVEFTDYAKIINKYTFTEQDQNPNNMPSTWSVQGSNDDITWDVLSNEADINDWANNETKTFTFSNLTPYKYYKFDITAINGATNFLVIGEIELIENELDGADGSTNTNTIDSVATFTTGNNTGPNAIVSAIVGDNVGFPANVFDDDVSTWVANTNGTGIDTIDLKLQFTDNSRIINKYTINATSTQIVDWKLYGSNDGTNWIMLDNVVNTVNLSGAATYSLQNRLSYEYYRFEFDAQATEGIVTFTEIELIEIIEPIPSLYTMTLPTQSAAPTSAKVVDRSKVLDAISKTFDGTNFIYTYDIDGSTGRHFSTKIHSSAVGTTINSIESDLNYSF